MFEINHGILKLTRGDSVVIPVNMTCGDDTCEMAEDDVLTLTVRKTYDSDTILLTATSTGDNCIVLPAADTAELPVGPLAYDVQLTTADGDVSTIVGPTLRCPLNMIVTGDVTR